VFKAVERPLVDSMASCTTEVLRHGVVGPNGSGIERYQEMDLGLESGYAPGLRIASYVPVLRVPFGPPAAPVEVYTCERDVDQESSLDTIVRLALTKSPGGAFRLQLQHLGESDTRVFAVQPATGRVGVYSGLVHVGTLKLVVCIVQDENPASLRIALAHPGTQWTFQLVVLDAAGGSRAPLLQASTQRGNAAAFVGDNLALASTSLKLSSTMLPTRPQEVVTRLLARTSRRLFGGHAGSVVLSVAAEQLPEKSVRLRIRLYNPGSRVEKSTLLVQPLLDKFLASLGMPNAHKVSLAELEAAKHRVGSAALRLVRIHPDGSDLEMQNGPIPLELLGRASSRSELLAVGGRTTPQEDADRDHLLVTVECPPASFEVFGYTCSDDILRYSTNLRVRRFVAGQEDGCRDFHETELQPWLQDTGAEHLLGASRESELAAVVAHHCTTSGPIDLQRFQGLPGHR